MKTKKKSGKTLRKSGKSQGKIREFDGIKKVGTLISLLKYARCESQHLNNRMTDLHNPTTRDLEFHRSLAVREISSSFFPRLKIPKIATFYVE